MGQKVSTVESVERKAIEYEIFDKSFALVEKYIKYHTKGLRNAFNREYEWVLVNEVNGELNWHKIMPKHMKSCKGMPYIHAIQTVSAMVKEAEELSSRSDHRFADKHKFRDVYGLVDELIVMIDKGQEQEVRCLCFTHAKGYEYENQEYIRKAWDEFRFGHD